MPVPRPRIGMVEIKGDGLVSDAYDAVKKKISKVYEWVADKVLPSDLPSAFKTRLQKYADFMITDIIIGRDPVNSVIQKLLNVLTLGKYSMMKRKLYYDDVFHLYSIITVQKGSQHVRLRLEKNNVVVLKETGDQPKDYIKIDLNGKTIPLGEYIGKTIQNMGKVEFVRYDAIKNNCQRFQTELLRSNGLLNGEANKFINQDVKQLLSEPAYGFSRVITDLGNVLGHMAGGKKKRKTVKQTGGCAPCQGGSGKVRF
jgi:hypothetical protein